MADVKIQEDWKELLQKEFNQPYFDNLTSFVKEEYRTKTIYPKGKEIFNAFNATRPQDVKVVIIGQDPYHGPGQANGLCFSVADGIPMPPSLINIFKEIQEDLGKPMPSTGNLTRWAKQGVLLLNATLTVRRGEAGSHQNRGWEEFTDAVIKKVAHQYENVVFMLWGSFAKRKQNLIQGTNNLILTSGHPSPLSANRNLWFGNKHFSQANEYLVSHGKNPIEW